MKIFRVDNPHTKSLRFWEWLTAIDNIFIERLWRSVKYEHVYLFPASDGLECYRGLKTYFEYYNNERRHQSLEDEIPVEVYHRAKQKEVA